MISDLNSRSFVVALILIVPFLGASCESRAAQKRLVYRVDRVQILEATVAKDVAVVRLRIAGTARTGGWKNPSLRPLGATDDTAIAELVATPPEEGSFVTQALTPLQFETVWRVPRGKSFVEVRAETSRQKVRIPLPE